MILYYQLLDTVSSSDIHGWDSTILPGYLEPSSYYICHNQEIISYLGRCNGDDDCFDGSDENNCSDSIGI